jgi:hypothetical protein
MGRASPFDCNNVVLWVWFLLEHQLRQLGDIRRDASRLIVCEQLGGRIAARGNLPTEGSTTKVNQVAARQNACWRRLTMAPKTTKPDRGIWKHSDPDVKVLDFSYESDVMAQLVVDAWSNNTLKTTLLDHTNQRAGGSS